MIELETRHLGLAVALLSMSCSVFDENLIPGRNFRVTNECAQDSQPIASFNDYHEVALDGLKNDQHSLPDCLGGATADGTDFFLPVSMQKDDKWHFHASGQRTTAVGSKENVDPAIYVLTGCDDQQRNCKDQTYGINNCGSGRDEHLSFVAPSTQTYYVGVDYVGSADVPTAGSTVEFLAVKAVCGNNIKEHPEYCDDGNTDPTDGCDNCQQALKSGEDETLSSKNDGPLDTTVLVLDRDQLATLTKPYMFSITGILLNECDFDFYEFDLSGAPAQTKVTAELSGSDALCSHADLRLEPDDAAPFALGKVSNSCPTSTLPLTPGKHVVRVASQPTVTPALAQEPYTLTLTFVAP